MARTQDALYADIDLDLSWSERDLPERERTKHVHRLHPYLGKFIPQLVEVLLARYVPAKGRVLDPFAGSGTTLVQGLESGHDAAGVDVAAFNCLLMGVKTRRYDLFALESEIRDVVRRLEVLEGVKGAKGYGRRVVCSTDRLGAARIPRARLGVRARGRPSGRPRTRRAVGAADDPLRPRLPPGAAAGPYWCHKHKRLCRPIDRAEHFLRRYSLDTLQRIKDFSPGSREGARRS